MMKKMMDKITVWLAVMIIIVMLASSLAGCVTPFSDEKVANEPAMNYDYETEFFQ